MPDSQVVLTWFPEERGEQSYGLSTGEDKEHVFCLPCLLAKPKDRHIPDGETKKQISGSWSFSFSFITPPMWSIWRGCALQRLLMVVLVCSLSVISWKVSLPLNTLKTDPGLSKQRHFLTTPPIRKVRKLLIQVTDLEVVFFLYKTWSVYAYIMQLPPWHPYTASPLTRKHVGIEHQFENGAELRHKAISRSLEIFAVQPGWEGNRGHKAVRLVGFTA